jgi:hypothetical protein
MTHPIVMPEGLDDAHKPIWADIVEYAPPGILAAVDHWLVEMTCYSLDRLRRDQLCATEMTVLADNFRRMLFAPDRRYQLVTRYLPSSWMDDLGVVTRGSFTQNVQ